MIDVLFDHPKKKPQMSGMALIILRFFSRHTPLTINTMLILLLGLIKDLFHQDYLYICFLFSYIFTIWNFTNIIALIQLFPNRLFTASLTFYLKQHFKISISKVELIIIASCTLKASTQVSMSPESSAFCLHHLKLPGVVFLHISMV